MTFHQTLGDPCKRETLAEHPEKVIEWHTKYGRCKKGNFAQEKTFIMMKIVFTVLIRQAQGSLWTPSVSQWWWRLRWYDHISFAKNSQSFLRRSSFYIRTHQPNDKRDELLAAFVLPPKWPRSKYSSRFGGRSVSLIFDWFTFLPEHTKSHPF
jgi:hypothetical protein